MKTIHLKGRMRPGLGISTVALCLEVNQIYMQVLHGAKVIFDVTYLDMCEIHVYRCKLPGSVEDVNC